MLNYAVIDLEILRKNALNVKRKLNKGVLFNAVVKADAYGHGAAKVAGALYNICDSFSVALVEEGVTLRLSGIDKEILVLLPPFKDDIPVAVKHNLTLTVESIFDVIRINEECVRQNRTAGVHVKINTGMNRLGVSEIKELKEILDKIASCEKVKLKGAFTHFGAPQNKKSLKSAENKFLLANNLVKGYNNNAVCHSSASGGFLMGAKSDMVRIGILLYGYKPFESQLVSVKPIMKVYSPIVGLKSLKKGDYALYGNSMLKGDAFMTLVRYGYADGLFRVKSGDLINNRCMDVSGYTDIKIKDDFACVMDDAQEIARLNGTISYEVLTKCALRAEKIYLN